MSDATGRTGFRVTHTKAIGERRAIVHEMMRELDPKAVEYWARENENIVVEDEVLNRAYVNDGTGKFIRATSMQQVLDYGQSRVDRLTSPLREDKPDKKGKMRGGTVTTSMFVAHLPKSMCEEVPDFYGKGRSRWIARDRGEAQRYFKDVLRFLGKNVIPGGYEAILGFDVQYSETTPHVQVLADTFADDPKHEGGLRPEWSRAYAAHRDVQGEDGKMLTGRQKLERYQDDLKAYMVARGWPVEREVDPLRHDKTETKATYGAMRDERRALDAQREELMRDGKDLEREEYRVSLARKEVEEERSTARKQVLKARDAAQEARLHLTSVKASRPLSDEQALAFFAEGVKLFANILVKATPDPAVKALIEARRQACLNFAGSEKFVDFAKSVNSTKAITRERILDRAERRQRSVERSVREVAETLDTTQPEHDDGMSL